MFEKILYPTDFSDVSKKALPHIKKMKEAGTQQIIVLRVIDQRKVENISRGVGWSGLGVAEFLKQTTQWLEDEAKNEMEPIETELREAGIEVKVRVETGDPHTRIVEVAEEENVSAIVLGSHGRSNIGSMLLGSVASHVVHHAKVPVLIINRD